MCFLSLGSIKRRASLLASDADGFGTTGFAGDLRKATNSILAKLEHRISSMTRAQKAETFAVSSRRPIRNGGRSAGESRKYRIIRTLDSSLTCNQYAKKRPKVGSGLETLRTENCVKTNLQPISYCPPLAAVIANGRLSSITNSVPAGSIADLLLPSQ